MAGLLDLFVHVQAYHHLSSFLRATVYQYILIFRQLFDYEQRNFSLFEGNVIFFTKCYNVYVLYILVLRAHKENINKAFFCFRTDRIAFATPEERLIFRKVLSHHLFTLYLKLPFLGVIRQNFKLHISLLLKKYSFKCHLNSNER